MRLSDYITKHGDAICAKRFKVKLRTVASWRRKERTPLPEQAKKIVRITEGEVSLTEIF